MTEDETKTKWCPMVRYRTVSTDVYEKDARVFGEKVMSRLDGGLWLYRLVADERGNSYG